MENLLSKYISYLKVKGFKVAEGSESNLINVRYPENENTYTITIDVNTPFPYDFPKIYIDTEFRKRNNINAHVFVGNSLCLKLSGKEIVNPTKDKEILEYALQKACRIIDRAKEGTLNIDKTQEINEYWKLSNSKEHSFNCISFFRPEKSDEIVSFGKYYIDANNLYIYVFEEDYYGKDYINEFYLNSTQKTSSFRCMFVKVDNTETAYDLRIFSNLISYLKSLNREDIDKYLNDTSQICLITIIVSSDKNAQYSTMFFKSENKEVETELSEETEFEASSFTAINIIPKILSQTALFNRSSDGIINTNFKKICIVGCGSVGSSIASKFASAGTEEFFLIDFDILDENNLLRHVCGVDSIEMFKTNALRRNLLNNYPYLKINEATTSVFNCSKDIFVEAQFDLIVVATADRSSEIYCLDEFLSSRIASNLAILWVEPFAVSGHALVYNEKNWNKGNFDLLQSNINHISSVNNSEDFFKKEVGCNSAYIPYSGLDVEDFVISFLKYMKLYNGITFSFSKFLNLNAAKRDVNMEINPNYYGFSDGDILVGEIYDE